jgi:hypothetical protein
MRIVPFRRAWDAVTFQIGTPMCLRDQLQLRAARFHSKRRQRSRDSHCPVAIGKEGSPVAADTDRKSGYLDTYIT